MKIAQMETGAFIIECLQCHSYHPRVFVNGVAVGCDIRGLSDVPVIKG